MEKTDISQRLKRRRQWWSEKKKQNESTTDNTEVQKTDEKSIQTYSTSNPRGFQARLAEDTTCEKRQSKRGFQARLTEDTTCEKRQSKPGFQARLTEDTTCEKQLSKPKTQEAHIKSDKTEGHNKKEKTPKKKSKHYVLFVGNLPFSMTEDEVAAYFDQNTANGVKAVRLLTKKDTGNSRGCAYVEFVNQRSHRLGLQLHQTSVEGRKINVEFTSAGRKTKRRTESLKKKNMIAARLKIDYSKFSTKQ